MKPENRARRTNQAQVPAVLTGPISRDCPVCDARRGYHCVKIVAGREEVRKAFHPERKRP